MLLLALLMGGLQEAGARPNPQALSARIEVREHTARAILFELRVRNDSGHRLTLALGGRPAYNVLVKRPDGTLIWEWQRGQIVQQILEYRSLDPGEELHFEATWKLVDARGRRVPAGEYLVHGVLNLEPPETLVTDSLRVRVAPAKRRRSAK
ncbi:hypothetical protein HRbin08_01890 [bacterium HR08]|nr:hypothetical protein HRbin08_01890 [bacterium HR08]